MAKKKKEAKVVKISSASTSSTSNTKRRYKFNNEEVFMRILVNYNKKDKGKVKTHGSLGALQQELHAAFASVSGQVNKGKRVPTRAEIALQLASIKRKFKAATGKTLMLGIPEQCDWTEFDKWAE